MEEVYKGVGGVKRTRLALVRFQIGGVTDFHDD